MVAMRRRKLDTPDEIEKVCELHYLTNSTFDQLAVRFGVSHGTVRRVIDEHGGRYFLEHKEEIDRFRKKYHNW